MSIAPKSGDVFAHSSVGGGYYRPQRAGWGGATLPTAREGVPITVQSLCNIEFCLPSNYQLHKPVGKGAYGLVVSATRTFR